MWDIRYIYEGFLIWIILNVLISQIGNLGLYNWFYHIYFTWCLIACSSVPLHTTRFFNTCFWLEFIDTHMHVPARHLALALPLVGEFLTPLNLHVQILEFGACAFSRLLIWDAQRKRGSSADHPEPFSSRPPTRLLSFSFVTYELLLCCSYLYISLYILVFTHISNVIFL